MLDCNSYLVLYIYIYILRVLYMQGSACRYREIPGASQGDNRVKGITRIPVLAGNVGQGVAF